MGKESEYKGPIHKPKDHWASEHMDTLRSMGWNFTPAAKPDYNPMVVAHIDGKTPELIERWKASREPVEMSIVAVMPNSGMSDLPARSLAYAATALSLTDTMQRRGVNVDTLRIVSPCKINAFCNSGDKDQQVESAKRFKDLVSAYKTTYLPQLDAVNVTLDTGIAISDDTVIELTRRAQQIKDAHPDVAMNLASVAQRYVHNENVDNGMDPSLVPLTYLLAHPEAWGYSDEEVLFGRNGQRRINFMPASELRYLSAMKKAEGVWIPTLDKAISTMISAKQRTAPYYPNKGVIQEPTLGDLRDERLNAHIDKLRPHTGRTEIAEVITNLNQLKTHIDQSAIQRKRDKQGTGISLEELVSAHL